MLPARLLAKKSTLGLPSGDVAAKTRGGSANAPSPSDLGPRTTIRSTSDGGNPEQMYLVDAWGICPNRAARNHDGWVVVERRNWPNTCKLKQKTSQLRQARGKLGLSWADFGRSRGNSSRSAASVRAALLRHAGGMWAAQRRHVGGICVARERCRLGKTEQSQGL